VRPDPDQHRRLIDALTGAGFTADHTTRRWTRTRADGRATVTVDGAVRLHVQPHHGTAWQATFAMSTPPAAILAAANT